MTATVREVKDKKDLKNFINLPWELYKNDPKWVPPLKMSVAEYFKADHPFYKTAETKTFIAEENGKVVGRIMAVINHAYNEFHEDKVGFFGFFEVINRPEIADSLLAQAEEWLKAKGAKSSIGPVNLSTNYECGLLVDGWDDPPQLMMSYNPRNYGEMIERNGYEKAKDLLAYNFDPRKGMPEIIKKISKRTEEKANVTFRKISKKHWDRDIETMKEIYNDAWEKNWGFVPMTPDEFAHTAKDMKSIVDPNLIIFADVKGEPAAFIVTLPDYNQVFKKIPNGKLLPTGIFKLLNSKKHITRCRTITLGVKHKYRNLGLASLLYVKGHDEVMNNGYTEVEMSWILEDNHNMNKPLLTMGAKPYKKYRIFEKKLQ